jgi:hypothetical protein
VSGLPFGRLIERLIDLGFERHREKSAVERDSGRVLGVDYGDRTSAWP